MLHITTTSHLYSCKPKDKFELRRIIASRILEDGPDCDLNDIDVSHINDLSYLFSGLTQYYHDIFKDFNCDISRWDVSNVTNMKYMFFGRTSFNCDLSKWNVSKVTDIASMFYFCSSFNQDIDRWNVSNVENMKHAFFECPTQPEWYNDEDSNTNKFKFVYYPIISPL